MRPSLLPFAAIALVVVLTPPVLRAQFAPLPPAPPPPEPAPAVPVKSWLFSLGAGFTFSKGNSNSLNENASLNLQWDPKTVRTFKLEALYLKESEDNEAKTDKASASARYDRTWRKNRYSFLETSYTRDVFKDIGYLISPRLGLGLNLAKSERLKISLDASGGTATEKRLDGSSSTGAALQLGQTVDFTLPNHKLSERSTALFKSGDFNDTIYHIDVGITSSIARHMDLKITYIWDYKSQPDAGDLVNSDTSVVATFLLKW